MLTPDFPPNLYGLPRRRVALPNGEQFLVCSKIVRIDIDEPGKRGTHGWQLRHAGETRLFSDFSNKLGTVSPFSALQAAVNALSRRYEGPSLRRLHVEMRDKRLKSGFPGITIVEKRTKGRNVIQYYVEAVCPEGKRSSKRFYVGTENTYSDELLQAKIKQAFIYRQRLQDEIEADRRQLHYQGVLRALANA